MKNGLGAFPRGFPYLITKNVFWQNISSSKTCVVCDEFTPLPHSSMHPEGIRSLIVGNAGGASEISEAWSIDLISKTLNSKESVLETEIEYTLIYGMVDYILKIDTEFGHHRIGVSVTRAICNPWKPYTWEEGVRLLNKKINGLVMSHEAISFNQSFYQSILHIWVPSDEIAAMLLCIIASSDLDIPNPCETLDIWITVTDYTPIFTNGSCHYPIKGLKDISYEE